jgi:hypothetical protein
MHIMNNNEYLRETLRLQTLAPESEELKALQQHRTDVEDTLRKHFNESSPTIRYGGSRAKGTMIKESYDLDIISYFSHNDTAAGETLEEIYNNTAHALEPKYLIERKSSALRLKDRNPQRRGVDFHIDVVPGRFLDQSKSDTFLYQSSGEKKRLKTNLEVHLSHVRDSGVVDAIRLVKLWRERKGLMFKTFVLELLVIKLLKDEQSASLAHQLEHVWTEFRDHADSLSVEDPANPSGNDLSQLLNTSLRFNLSSVATHTLQTLQDNGWHAVFGPIEEMTETDTLGMLRQAAGSSTIRTKPWSANS